MTRRMGIARLSLQMAVLIAGLGAGLSGPAAGEAPSRPASSPQRSSVEAGWDLLRQGRHREAIGVLTAAKARYRDEPMLFLGLGVAQYRLMELGPAAANLRRALELNPDLEEAHTIMGAIAFAHDELDSSIRHYEQALKLNPNDVAIQDQLFAVRRAADAEGTLQRLTHPHVIVKYEPSHRDVAFRVAERWEVIHRRIGRQLEDASAERTIVILYAHDRFRRLTDTPPWAAGLFDGRVHLGVEAMQNRLDAVDAALAHEYAHVLVHRLAGGRAPAWLEEGLALYFEGRDRTGSEDLLTSKGVDFIPLHALHESFLGLPAEHARIAYAESHSAACTLIDRYGLKQMRRLLASVAAAPDFAEAFETVLKSPYHEFEAAWMRERQRRL